jgi:sugar phosphate isomerase/epimerase
MMKGMVIIMKLSVSAWCLQEKLFGNEITIFDFIRFCHENGVKYVELLDCFLDGEEDIVKINKLLKELDMEVSAYSIGNDFVLADAGERQEQVEYVKEGIDTALKLGTGILRVFSGDKKEGMSFEKAENWIVECFKELAPHAENKGVTMVLENHGLLAGKSEQVKRIIDRVGSKALRSNSDVGNFILVNENSLDAVKFLMDKLGFIHLKDFKKANDENGYAAIDGAVFQGIVLGKGDVPIADIIKYLKAYGYGGFLSIEYEGPGDPAEGTTQCIEYTKHAIE